MFGVCCFGDNCLTCSARMEVKGAGLLSSRHSPLYLQKLQYTVMPFWLGKAPATLQWEIHNVLLGVKNCEAYLGAGAYSDTWEEHMETLSLIFSCIDESPSVLPPVWPSVNLERLQLHTWANGSDRGWCVVLRERCCQC